MSSSCSQPKVSIVMPVYNSEESINLAIGSVLWQSYENWELLIVDDGSTDDTLSLALQQTDPRIRCISLGSHLGISAALNEGIRSVSEDASFVARMDSDDLMLPERLEIQVDFLRKHPHIDVVGSAMFVSSVKHPNMSPMRTEPPVDSLSIAHTLKEYNCIAHPTVMFRKSCLKDVVYRSECDGWEDYDLWQRMMDLGYTFHNIPQPLLLYMTE